MSGFRLAGFAIGRLAFVGLLGTALSGAPYVHLASGLMAASAVMIVADGVATGVVWARGSDIARLRPAGRFLARV